MLIKQRLDKITIGAAIVLLAFVIGCSSSQESSDIDIEEVLSDTNRNLVFVQGGEFLVG